MRSKLFSARKISNLVRVYQPENNSGSKNFIGLLVLKEFLLFQVETPIKTNF